MGARRLSRAAALGAAGLALAAAGCGGDPPRSLAGFSLGMSQERVMDAVRARGGFTCNVRGTRPPMTSCEGPSEDGPVRVVVRQDTAVEIALLMDPDVRNPRRAMRRYVRPFGPPAWRERPYPSRAAAVEGYHTLWLDRDTTRAIALVCAGRDLVPPCTVELTRTSPARILAVLDSLLDARQPPPAPNRSR